MTRLAAIAAFLVLLSVQTASADEEKLVTIKTQRGAEQTFILIRPKDPFASVILFAGGHGGLGINGTDSFEWGEENFVVRARKDFAAKGLMVALVDAPSDMSQLKGTFRLSRKHAGDIADVAKHLKGIKDVPVWMVGFSMGTFSAANVAIKKRRAVSGLVLVSTMAGAREGWKITEKFPEGVVSMNLRKVRAPTLILAHEDDRCDYTPPKKGAAKLKDKLTNASAVKVVFITGGSGQRKDECGSEGPHGFLGVEDQAVSAVAGFIKASVNGGSAGTLSGGMRSSSAGRPKATDCAGQITETEKQYAASKAKYRYSDRLQSVVERLLKKARTRLDEGKKRGCFKLVKKARDKIASRESKAGGSR
ncbi:MAG: alpha/beta hydrolase [Alphaproteobacteria bacterium]|nr:alpha/beta hydrolase [Alphaproteobacteria bacterium]